MPNQASEFDRPPDWNSISDRVVADARRLFRDQAAESVIDASARRAVDEFTRNPVRLTTFVPLLALRRTGELLTSRHTTISRLE